MVLVVIALGTPSAITAHAAGPTLARSTRVLQRVPQHSRARVARAWIDYIVDTKMARGTRWLLGGGSKKRAFIGAREAASAESEFFVRVEAEFALWEMLVRERNVPEATTIARKLARDFPENRKLTRFLNAADPGLRP